MRTRESSGARRGGFSALVVIAYRNIYRNGRRTTLCVVAIGIAVFFNIFMQGWMDGMLASIESVVRTFESGHVQVVTEKFEDDREYLPVQYPVGEGTGLGAMIGKIEELPHVAAALPRITSYATLFDSTVKHAFLWGIDLEREMKLNDFNLTKRNDGLAMGRYPSGDANECAIGSGLARKTGLGLGDRIPLKTVSSQLSDKYYSPVITGIFEFDYGKYDDNYIIVPFARLARLLSMGDATQALFVYADDPKNAASVKADVAAIVGPGHVVREWREHYFVAVMRQSNVYFLVIFGVFIVVASFLIINTVVMVIHERIKEIGMLGALGMTRREIVTVFFLEAVFLSVLGAAAGCVLGGAATYVGSLFPLDLDLFTGGGMKDMPMAGTLFIAFSPASILSGFVFGVVVSAFCTIFPSLKSAFIEPVEALRR